MRNRVYAKTCAICGLPFESGSPAGKICPRDHWVNCAICGKSFIATKEQLLSGSKLLCSKSCANRAKGQSYLTAKKYDCTCRICGQTVQSRNKQSDVCYNHTTAKCAYCGVEFPITREELIRGKKTCSDECKVKLSHQTYQSNYGKESNPENYAMLQSKVATTMKERYGVANILQSPEMRAKINQTMRERYGEHRELIVAKQRATNLEKYGAEFLQQVDEFKERSRKTCLERYGVENYAQSVAFHAQSIIDPSKAENATSFNNDARAFILSHFKEQLPTLRDLSKLCGMRESSVGWIVDSQHCQDLVALAYSYIEDELFEFLRSILPENAEIQRNTFKVITPYELDIYLPEYKFAIECNPTWTHNSSIAIYQGTGQGDKPKPRNYHKMKTDLCESQGIFLFHVFGYEWTHRSDIIKSMIANNLGVTSCKIGARNTEVREVSQQVASDFLTANHRQGSCIAKVRLGLYYKNELVSLMTFSRMRNTIGASIDCPDECWELSRFCSRLNTTVIGGASKLFKYFVEKFDPDEIRSFSDRAHTKGTLYETLGFKYAHTSDPGYMWVSIKTDVGYARNNAQKQNIKTFLNDENIDLSKTEVQIMEEHDFVQVFDSGVKLWIWRKEV